MCSVKSKNIFVPKKCNSDGELVDFSDFDNSENMTLDSLRLILMKVVTNIDNLTETVKSVEKSISFCSDHNDDFSVKLKSAMKKISNMESKIKTMELNNDKLNKEVNMLR